MTFEEDSTLNDLDLCDSSLSCVVSCIDLLLLPVMSCCVVTDLEIQGVLY